MRGALDGISIDEVARGRRTTAPTRTCSSTSSAWSSQACGEDVAGRLHTARSRNDIDMTMYRMRQREFILALLDGDARAARERCSTWPTAIATRCIAAHTHTQPAQPSTVAHYLLAVIEQLERDARAAEGAPTRSTNRNPLGACAITGTGFPDRPRPARASCSGFDGPTGNTYGSIATVDYLLESVSAAAVLARRARPRRPGPAALVHDGVRLPAPRRRLRAGQQHHAAEAQPGGARARARDRQQGARPGAGDRHSPSTTRPSATSSTPRTTCSRSWRRCSGTRCAR